MAECLCDESRRDMTKKQISAVILAAALPAIAYFVSEDIRCMQYLKEPDEINHRQVSSIEMSGKDRMKDFETLWKVVSEGIPAVRKYPGEFGYDIVAAKEKYLNAVKNASSDVEFMCIMQSLLNDVPSVHTGFFFPDYKVICDYNCMASEIVKTNPYLHDAAELWNREMKNYYRQSRMYEFDYVDGKYCYSLKNSELKLPEINYTIKSVNGKSPDEYITGILSSSKLRYDEEHKKMYRKMLVFNDSRGEKVTVGLEDAGGRVTEHEFYCDLCDEYMFVNQPYLHGTYEKPDDVYDIRYMDESQDEKTVYLRIDDLDNEKGAELAEKIRKFCSGSSVPVILDLRRNGGGTLEYTADCVYSPLFSDNITVKEKEYIMKSSGNRDFFRGVYATMNKRVFGLRKISGDEVSEVSDCPAGETLFEYNIEKSFTGTNRNRPAVCVLVSDITASSADYLVSAVSELENTVIIGENTGGEKTGGQFMAMLPESRLVYYYNASVCLNSDGSDNSLHGTAPDIWCRLSTSGFRKYNELVSEGQNPETLKNRLLWDDVLIRAAEEVKNIK